MLTLHSSMMATCPACTAPTPPDARFCPDCGARLGKTVPVSPGTGVRKTVTVLFCDVVDSTTLGATRDPEVVRRVMTRYHDTMKVLVESHGGMVEKFIGDAVMAVFGLPAAHEDDASRAVRAAAAMREALAPLNESLETEHGVTIALRMGLTTGEVITGDAVSGGMFATGDAVNTAARLQTAAQPGEIILDDATARLAGEVARLEPMPPLAVKGKSEAVHVSRLLNVEPARARPVRITAPMLGRATELGVLLERIEEAYRRSRPELVTVAGTAGVGKSRLVREAIGAVGARAWVLVGRCLPYGDGITWWPVREIIHEAAGIDESDDVAAARARLSALVGESGVDPRVEPIVAGTIGLSSEAVVSDERFWALRSLLEGLGRQRPLLLVVEDLHWAEPTLLHFVEYLVDQVFDSALAIVGTARPDLGEAHPTWASGRERAHVLRLEALGAETARRLVVAQVGGTAVPAALAERIAAAAEGNPLFLEEMVGLLRERGELMETTDNGWTFTGSIAAMELPPTIRALLAARIDGLPAADRQVARRAAVIGRSFEAAALVALSPAEARGTLAGCLLDLVRRELLRPDRAALTIGDAYRFRHVLLRDAAYEALAKADRAALHAAFADWLMEVAGDRGDEYEEILGFHLERAHRYRSELGDRSPATGALADAAAGHLLRAGRRAAWSGDTAAAVGLLERAWDLARDPATRFEAGHELAMLCAWAEDYQRGRELADGLDALAASTGAATQRALAGSLRMHLDMFGPGDEDAPDHAVVLRTAQEHLAVLRDLGDDRALAYAHLMEGMALHQSMRMVDAMRANHRAERAAAAAGDRMLERRMRILRHQDLAWGPGTAQDGLARIEADLPGLEHQPIAHGLALVACGVLTTYLGRFDDGRRMWRQGAEAVRGTGEEYWLPNLAADHARIEFAAGDHAVAEDDVREAAQQMARVGDTSTRVLLLAILARLLVGQGRTSEADAVIDEALEVVAGTDVWSQFAIRQALALVRLEQGLPAEAVTLADEAAALVPLDAPVDCGDTYLVLARARHAVGDVDGARAAVDEAIDAYGRKGATALVDQARTLWATLTTAASAGDPAPQG